MNKKPSVKKYWGNCSLIFKIFLTQYRTY